jgi:hypothetical protein
MNRVLEFSISEISFWHGLEISLLNGVKITTGGLEILRSFIINLIAPNGRAGDRGTYKLSKSLNECRGTRTRTRDGSNKDRWVVKASKGKNNGVTMAA